jgi:starch-binding outer membrane protein, SusD/RagB family
MKNKLIIFSLTIVAVSAIIFFSCKQSFLDRPPQGVYSVNQLSNKKGVNGMLISAYATLDGRQGSWYEGGSNWVWGSVAGADALKGSEKTDQVDVNPIMKYDFSPTNPIIGQKWNAVWDGVGQANQVLKTLPLASDMTDAEKKQVEGEAKFIRGFWHFEGKKMFKNIPYVDEKVVDFKIPNASGPGVYINVWPQIEADLKFAYDNLDETKPNKGRVNKWAAGSFLAKAYMFQNKFTEAKALFDVIIASGKTAEGKTYDLTPNFHDNFKVGTEHNVESIFAIESTYGDGSTTNGNYDNALNYPHSPSTPGAGCCGFFQPTQNLVNSFKTDALGLPMPDTYNNSDVTRDAALRSSDPFTPYAGNLDPRLDWTVGRRGIPYLDWGVHPGRDWIRDVTFGGPYAPKKNVFYKADLPNLAASVGWGWNNEALNVPLMRFADVLLMAAEAEVEVGSLAKALIYVNRVRARAAASPVKTAGGANAANYVVNPYVAFATKDEAKKAVRFERKLELAMEGHRFFDLVRWGIAATTINTEYLPKESALLPDPLGGGTFTAGKNEYFPIPTFAIVQSAKDGTPTLTQNPNY